MSFGVPTRQRRFDAKQIVCTIVGGVFGVGLIFLVGIHIGKRVGATGPAEAIAATADASAGLTMEAEAPQVPTSAELDGDVEVENEDYHFFELLDAPAPTRDLPEVELAINPVLDERKKKKRARRNSEDDEKSDGERTEKDDRRDRKKAKKTAGARTTAPERRGEKRERARASASEKSRKTRRSESSRSSSHRARRTAGVEKRADEGGSADAAADTSQRGSARTARPHQQPKMPAAVSALTRGPDLADDMAPPKRKASARASRRAQPGSASLDADDAGKAAKGGGAASGEKKPESGEKKLESGEKKSRARQKKSEARQKKSEARQRKRSRSRFTVQVSAFQDRAAANALVDTLRSRGHRARVRKEKIDGRGIWYRVQVGRFGSRDEASKARGEIKSSAGYDGFVTPL